ncbi:Bud-site selection protein [Apodospora peruviana]|uniref:Bud-site selection protein n=1 Tax=Apodospora peruviana TaxID=516989 RepID=A0AAE0I0P2_9PEZI|nr:Bud-site selection protein [Apodospora peruviana]
MPKRKRSDEEELEKLLASFHNELHHALKQAKGYERQRQAKRLRDSKSTVEKKQRIQNEIVVLKSLDLHQTAHAHLCSVLLRVKSIAESPKLPAEIKAGVAKPDLTEEEKAALHNVTSALFCRQEVRAVTDKAVTGVCGALGVPVPEKKKGVRVRANQLSKGSAAADGEEEEEEDKKEQAVKSMKTEKKSSRVGQAEEEAEDIDEVAEKEEEVLKRLDDLLGSSSEDEDDEEESMPQQPAKNSKSKASTEELDPMEITSGEEEVEADEYDVDIDPMEITSDEEGQSDSDGEDEDENRESGSFNGFSDNNPPHPNNSNSDDSESESSASSAGGLSPPRKKKTNNIKKQPNEEHLSGSAFLPTLMGGYISGSDSSASDLDLAPRRNRRGQRARQAIWEKKFKEEARHVKNGTPATRDAGWDMRRGAVEGEVGKPWKAGVRNPLLEKKAARRAAGIRGPAVPSGGGGPAPAPAKGRASSKKRDDTGPLHPSWEARKKAKAAMPESAPFQGKKITFD